jgi:hypothetical protein
MVRETPREREAGACFRSRGSSGRTRRGAALRVLIYADYQPDDRREADLVERAFEAYRGHDGARRAWREYRGEAWEHLTIRPQEFRDLGESVLVLSQSDFTARTTGIEFSQEIGSLRVSRGEGRSRPRLSDSCGGSRSRRAFGVSDVPAECKGCEECRRRGERHDPDAFFAHLSRLSSRRRAATCCRGFEASSRGQRGRAYRNRRLGVAPAAVIASDAPPLLLPGASE